MKNIFNTIIILLFSQAIIFAQNQTDALRYSQIFYGGTARSIGMGNSMSAIGGDLSVLATNPAGIAVFKKSQFNLTPYFGMNNTNSSYLGNTFDNTDYHVKLNNMAFVGAFNGSDGWDQINFGIAYNRTGDYNQEIIINGKNNSNSILDYYIYNANNNNYSSFRENLAWETYLISFDSTAYNGAGEYYSAVTDAGFYGETQRRLITREGGSGEWDFSLGASHKNKLFIGGTIGVTSINYKYKNVYKEEEFEPVITNNISMDPKYFEFNETLSAKGTGINFKAGALYRPVKFLSVGAAVHSTTFYSISEEYETSMYSQFYSEDQNGDSDYFWNTDLNLYSYKLQTPFRANLSAAVILDSYKIGTFYSFPMTFNVEYEYVNYTKMQLASKEASEDFISSNKAVKDWYQATQNIRAGYEISFGLVMLRAGYAIYGNPLKGTKFTDGRTIYSGGIGIHGENAYVDFAYSFASDSETVYIYDATPNFPSDPMGNIQEPTAKLSRKSQFYNITFGLKF